MKSQEANAIPLREILEKYGHEPVRSYHGYLMYSSPFRNEETPSFMVNLHTNKWKDFGEDSSGGVADLVMRLERCDFHSAMRRIEKSDLSAPSDPLPVPTSAGDAGTSPRLTVDNINPLTNRMLLEYMGRRGIDADIAKAYCKEAYYHFSGRKDRRCFAVAFPNDKAGMDALEKLEGNLGKDTVLVNESVRLYPRHNDFNEFLQACKKKAMTAGNEM